MFLNMDFSYMCVIYTHTYSVHICAIYRYIYMYIHICVRTHTYTPCSDLPHHCPVPPASSHMVPLSALILSAHNQSCPNTLYCLSTHFLNLMIVALVSVIKIKQSLGSVDRTKTWVLGSWRQKDQELEAIIGYMRYCIQK